MTGVPREHAEREARSLMRRWEAMLEHGNLGGEEPEPQEIMLARALLAALAELGQAREARSALIAMVYVHPCNCGDGIPARQCARCRSVAFLGFDPCIYDSALAGSDADGDES